LPRVDYRAPPGWLQRARPPPTHPLLDYWAPPARDGAEGGRAWRCQKAICETMFGKYACRGRARRCWESAKAGSCFAKPANSDGSDVWPSLICDDTTSLCASAPKISLQDLPQLGRPPSVLLSSTGRYQQDPSPPTQHRCAPDKSAMPARHRDAGRDWMKVNIAVLRTNTQIRIRLCLTALQTRVRRLQAGSSKQECRCKRRRIAYTGPSHSPGKQEFDII
jgi:hypothetical protein